MRTLLQTALVALVASLVHTADGQDRIPWSGNLDQARQVAAQQGRLVLIHFFTDDCAPCQQLERNVFNSPEFIRALSVNYVPVRLHARQVPELVQHFGVDRYPTDVIIRPDGTAVFRSVSPQETNQYIAMLDQVAGHDRLQMKAPVAQASTPAPGQGGYGPNPNSQGLTPSYTPSPTANNAVYGQQGPYGQQSPYGQSPAQVAGQTPNPNHSGNAFASRSVYGDSMGQPQPSQQAAVQGPYTSGYTDPTNVAPTNVEQPWNQYGPTAGAGPYGAASGFGSPSDASAYNSPSSQMQYGSPAAGQYGASPGPGNSGTPSPQTRPATSPNAPSAYGQIPGSHGPGNQVATGNGLGSTGYSSNAGLQYNPHVSQQAAHSSAPPVQTPTAQAPTAGASPQAHPQPAFDGHCPVTVVKGSQWKKGDRRWGAIHRDRLYLFAGPDEQREFLAAPDRYSPVLSGYDPIRFMKTGQLVEGKRDHGLMLDQIYLFADEASLNEFSSNYPYFSSEVQRITQQADARSMQQPTRR